MEEILKNYKYIGKRAGSDRILTQEDIGKVFCVDDPNKVGSKTIKQYYIVVGKYSDYSSYSYALLSFGVYERRDRMEYAHKYAKNPKNTLAELQENVTELVQRGILFTHQDFGGFHFFEYGTKVRRIGKYKITRR